MENKDYLFQNIKDCFPEAKKVAKKAREGAKLSGRTRTKHVDYVLADLLVNGLTPISPRKTKKK